MQKMLIFILFYFLHTFCEMYTVYLIYDRLDVQTNKKLVSYF